MATPRPHIRLVVYDKDHVDERTDVPLGEAVALAKGPGVGWLTIYDPSEDEYALLESELDLHPLALEDTRNQRQRPKVEEFASNAYIVVRTLRRAPPEPEEEPAEEDEPVVPGDILSEQSNIFLGNGWVLVIHERPLGVFDDVRERIRRGRPRIRTAGADYLAYALLDAVVDGYMPLITEIGDEIETLEEEIAADVDRRQIDRVYQLRHDLRVMRRTLWPTREALGTLLRDESKGFKRHTLPFLRDVHDHTAQALDLIESHTSATGSLVEFYLNMVSNRTNEVMKVLTIVATIFIPLTFIVGVYGMNFEVMPELGWNYGYPLIWAIMILVVVAELWYFRRRGWV